MCCRHIIPDCTCETGIQTSKFTLQLILLCHEVRARFWQYWKTSFGVQNRDLQKTTQFIHTRNIHSWSLNYGTQKKDQPNIAKNHLKIKFALKPPIHRSFYTITAVRCTCEQDIWVGSTTVVEATGQTLVQYPVYSSILSKNITCQVTAAPKEHIFSISHYVEWKKGYLLNWPV